MAERRMFAKTIIDSDAFLEMPISSQCLYFHLAMRADDDGFVNAPLKIMKFVGAKQDDIKVLIDKKFVIAFETGVVVIKHWKIHNYIRKDTYNETPYKELKEQLELDENNSYRIARQRSVNESSTQVSIGKDSIELDQDSIGKVNNNKKEKEEEKELTLENVQLFVKEHNSPASPKFMYEVLQIKKDEYIDWKEYAKKLFKL